MKYLLNRIIPPRRRLAILIFAVIAVMLCFLFAGKSNSTIEAISVSPSEEYVACFDAVSRYRIICFRADGTLAFEYEIPSDISAGGHCTLWFEDDCLCAFFYRTNKTVRFANDGAILDITEKTDEHERDKFDGFSSAKHKLIYDGNEIRVTYEKRSFWDYWFGGKERYLSIKSCDGNEVIVYAWTAKDGVTARAK